MVIFVAAYQIADDTQVVGVAALGPRAVGHDGVDRADGRRRVVDLVHQAADRGLERGRDVHSPQPQLAEEGQGLFRAPGGQAEVGAGVARRREPAAEQDRALAVEDRVAGDGEQLELIHA